MPTPLLPTVRSRHTPNCLKLAAVLTCGSAVLLCTANELYAQTVKPAAPPPFNIKFEANETWRHDTNVLRQVRDGFALTGTNTAAAVTVSNSTPTSKFSSYSQVDRGMFDDSRFDSTDFHQKGSIGTRNQRWSAKLDGSYDYDTTRTSEITNFGITVPRVRRNAWSLSPEVGFTPSKGHKFNLNTLYSRSGYDNAAFIDFNFYQIRPSYSRHYDELNTGVISFHADRFESTSGASNTIDTFGPSLGWTRIVSEQLSFKFNAGGQYAKQESNNAANNDSAINYTFSGDMTFKEDKDNLLFTLSRAQQPFANGISALFTTFKVNETHAINENLSLTGSGSYRYADYLNSTGTNLDTELSGSAGIAYKIYNNIDITGNYRYNNQTLTNTSGAIKQHIVMVGLSFHPLEKDLEW